jgi:hypothetical protein
MPVRIGNLEPKFSLLLNPYAQERLSRCPDCNKLTFPRKFALALHVEGYGFFVQGKMCKFCTNCAMVIIQQDDLEAQLANSASLVAPVMLGKEYVLIGVVDGKFFKQSLASPQSLPAMLAHVSDFKTQYGLSLRPAGWYKEGYEPPPLPARKSQIVPGSAALCDCERQR